MARPPKGLTTGARDTGLTAPGSATVESAQWIGEQGVKVIFRDSDGHPGEPFVYRDDEPSLELVEMGRPWSFDGDGDLLRLVSEAFRTGSDSFEIKTELPGYGTSGERRTRCGNLRPLVATRQYRASPPNTPRFARGDELL